MATFHPNPNIQATEPWIEHAALPGHPFRVWHVGMFCLAGFIAAGKFIRWFCNGILIEISFLVILVCCCVKLRIPRTKQEIEANYHRKKLVSKFKARIKLIQNQDMDEMDLKKGICVIAITYLMKA